MHNALIILLVGVFCSAAAAAEVPAGRQGELRHMLTHDCGSCHGLRLTGGLGPPLTKTSLTHKDATALAAIIRHGLPGTPMPPWKAMISVEEARWLAEFMKGSSNKGDTPQ
jgi:cytochrome c55X